MKNNGGKIILSYLMIYLVWGSTYFFIKMAVETIPPFYVVGLRFTAGGIAFITGSIITGNLRKIPSAKELLSAFFLGICLLVLGNGLVSIAEKSVDSYLAALTIAATPFCVAFFNKILFGERISKERLTGMILGILGVGLILYNGHNSTASLSTGILLVIGGLVSWSLATSVGHRMPVHENTLVNSGFQMLFAGISGLLISVAIYPQSGRILLNASLISWIGVIYLAVFGGAAFYCYAYLIKHEPSIRVASYAIVNPPIAVILGLAIGHEKPAQFLGIGLPVILLGLVLMLYGQKLATNIRK